MFKMIERENGKDPGMTEEKTCQVGASHQHSCWAEQRQRQRLCVNFIIVQTKW